MGFFNTIANSFIRGKFGKHQSKGSLTPKMGPKDFYKGRGCRSLGFHTRKGGFQVTKNKLPYFEIPDLTDFEVSYF